MPLHPWKPGQSGNPGGRPKRAFDVVERAKALTTEAIDALHKSLADPRTRVSAAIALLERGWGKPIQPVESNLTIHGGIDAPPRSQTWEEWNARWRADIAAMETSHMPGKVN